MIVRDARTTSRKTRTSQPLSAGSALRERRAKDSGVESASIPPSRLIGIALMGAIRVAVPGLRQGHFDAIPLPQPCVTGMRAACRKLARISIFPAFRASSAPPMLTLFRVARVGSSRASTSYSFSKTHAPRRQCENDSGATSLNPRRPRGIPVYHAARIVHAPISAPSPSPRTAGACRPFRRTGG